VAARRTVLRIAAMAVAKRLNADHGDAAPRRCGHCESVARYVDRRAKTFTTVLGEMRLERAYFHCDICHAGFCPRDVALGLENGSLSPHVLRMVGIVGSRVSFEEGHDLLKELAGIHVSVKQVEREAERLGREIDEYDKKFATPETERELPPTLYTGLDGTGIPARRSETEGRDGKQPDGSAKTREVKLCTVWSAEKVDDEGVPVRDEGSVTYSAAIESASTRDTDEALSPFAQRVKREAERRRFGEATRRVVLGDGAPWIWGIADELFPGAIQIIDRFHVNEHLAAVGKAIYGPEGDLHKQWTHLRCSDLKHGRLDAVLDALAAHPNLDAANECSEYIRKNRQRMRYGEFHAQGLCTSSAVVESGCKRAIGTRLKLGGMFWTVNGANAIIALRCTRLSGRFEDFWEWRTARRTG
jgi:hypothetical protein